MPEYALIAACWTTAGACEPMSDDDRSPLPMRDRVEAASQAGFRGFSIRYADLLEVERGPGVSAFRQLLDDNGIVHLELEFLEGWYAQGEERVRSDVQLADLLRAAEALGARHIKVGGDLAGGPFNADRIAAEFAKLAEDAAAAGTKVGLEPMPFADVKTPQMGLEVVRKAGHRAGGLFVDIWHVARAGVEFRSLSSLPVEHLLGVELNDALDQVRGTLLEDTFSWRRFPGEGDLDVQGFVDAIRSTGYGGPWGIEMLSTEFRQLPLVEATKHAFNTTIRFLNDPAVRQPS